MIRELTDKLLSRLLTDESKFFIVQDKVNDSVFIDDLDKSIFNSYKQQMLSKNKIDSVIIAEKTINPGEAIKRIDQLIKNVDYSTDFDTILYGVFKAVKQNKLKSLLGDLHKNIEDNVNHPDKTLTFLGDFINHFNDDNSLVLKSMNENVDDVFKIIEFHADGGELTGVPTGFIKLDGHTNGLQGGDLIIVAGETSQGKTSLALNIAYNSSESKNVYVFSLEMMSSQITARAISLESGVSSHHILTGHMTRYEIESLKKCSDGVRSRKIFIDDHATKIDRIISNIRMMKAINGVDLVIIDYLQLISSSLMANKEQQVADISRRLKNLAKELNIPIILISQLNRDKMKPFPVLSRLRDSGQIEEAADMVIFIYRASYYDIIEYDDGTPANGKAMIIIAKGRNTGTGRFYLDFNEQLTKFSDETDITEQIPF